MKKSLSPLSKQVKQLINLLAKGKSTFESFSLLCSFPLQYTSHSNSYHSRRLRASQLVKQTAGN